MPIVNLLIALVIVGVVLYLVNNYVPMVPWIKTVINVVVILAVIIWLLQSLGMTAGSGVRIGNGGVIR